MKVLVVVDMQNDFIGGSLGTPEAKAILPKVCKTMEEMASKDTMIIFTRDTHPTNYMETLEGKNLPVPHCIEGTEGWNLHPLIAATFEMIQDQYSDYGNLYPMIVDHMINKPTFGSLDLQNTLFALDEVEEIEEITLMGLCTGICVLSNAILAKATLPEVPVNVIKECCACVTPESHKTALEAMKLCQINII